MVRNALFTTLRNTRRYIKTICDVIFDIVQRFGALIDALWTVEQESVGLQYNQVTIAVLLSGETDRVNTVVQSFANYLWIIAHRS